MSCGRGASRARGSASGVRKRQGGGMQHQARNRVSAYHQGPAVARVPCNRPAHGGQVDANLVHPAGTRIHLQQSRARGFLTRYGNW